MAANNALVEAIFQVVWSDWPEDDIDTVETGEACLKAFLIILYNCCVKQKEKLLEKFLSADELGPRILYRVHRYIFVSQEDDATSCQEINEWFTMLLQQVLALDFGEENSDREFEVLKNLYNAFISKKVKENYKVINHVPSGGLSFL